MALTMIAIDGLGINIDGPCPSAQHQRAEDEMVAAKQSLEQKDAAMRSAYANSTILAPLFLLFAGPTLAQPLPGCDRATDEASRLETARSLLKVNARAGDVNHYDNVINYWAEDVTYKDPVFTNTGRHELYEYLTAIFSGTSYGFPLDREPEIRDEVYRTYPDDSMTYMATAQWSGTFGTEYYFQTGMSIIKFRPGKGCPSYHRDYYSEGDSWFSSDNRNNTIFTKIVREFYIYLFGLSNKCFDGDGDGYTKYPLTTGCVNAGLDCNDFLPDVNPGATELIENGIDDDCNPLTLDRAHIFF
jgi:hypothetical protein